MKNHTRIFWFMTFHTKLLLVQKHCILWLDKVDGFTKVYKGTRYSVLFGPEKHDAIYNIYNRIRYLVSQESGVTCFFS